MRGDRKKELLLVVTGLVIISGILIVPSLISPPFSWGIDEGNIFVYRVVFIRDTSDEGVPYPAIYELNNSLIWVNVSQLPSPDLISNGALFISKIVNQNKTICTLENGTELDHDALVLLSKCILPIGGWDSINSYFPTFSESLGLFPDTYLSEISDEFFRFGHRKLIHDDVSMNWFGYINMTTGIPVNVTQRYFNYNYLDTVTFTLVEIV